ncbi:probable glycoprotein hormone G-protein coupled receptor [Culex quinquefasciatus]|uniref:probable glycoprotein hormone G-protein coupled receptor n=1 Tax=Culex quinquefasciatus TaxID=7176 RepID=UPI0018E3362D|nr:probable glycoprotein hormone G-protein coupled receptor [Culex quinquefasciatus]XP_038104276.1 probable glycoprotein hormone G-protein coupled receptor [Culex quinquefasciatus]XP_038104277.1 probable glycoprotein hormone G-protein coupled receptor [Culex quinquefasciatus]XP_038104278.1 probable glycoprotein hormone G-protein coupled receptor [Culex quinquefasciatus]XP_038104279.1 probable glycoprotein hormone G-protein coupled receptor [Culex quinquefasciatus]XP_038104280.1 probable glycop
MTSFEPLGIVGGQQQQQQPYLFNNNGSSATLLDMDSPLVDGDLGNWTGPRFVQSSEEGTLDVTYAVFEGLVALMAVIGNAMVIVVFKRERRLRRRTNFYIVSLAVADFLVGLLGVPFAVLSSVGLPRNLHACLFTISLLIVLCTISIFCLVAVSVDRYWAILHPMAYSRNVRTKTAIVIISLCWLAGSIIGFLPLFGWHEKPQIDTCLFTKVMDYDYLVFLYFATIITPALIMLGFYAHIYRVIVKQLRQIVTMNPSGGLSSSSSESRRPSESSRIRISTTPSGRPGKHGHGGGTMLRVLGAAQKREVKATQNLSIIVLFFMICWIPLYTINCIVAFCRDCQIPPTLMLFCIILSHLNSAVNPLLYAYHLKDFRAALRNLIMSMLGYDVTTQDLNYRASLASQQQQIAQRHSIMDKRLSLQPKIYIDSPVYHRTQQQLLRSQQHSLVQQHSLERSESGASFQSLNTATATKKRLISSTRSDPGSPNVIVSTSAISPSESNCSTPQRYEPPPTRGTFEMWGIAEVSSINEDSGHRKSLEDLAPERASLEVDFDDLGAELQEILDNAKHHPPEEDRNVSALYSIVTAKRRSHSTCCIMAEPEVPSSLPDSVYLIENDSPTRILAKTTCNGADSVNNNNNFKVNSSPVGNRPISKSFSLFANVAATTATTAKPTSHSSLFKLFASGPAGKHQRILQRSFKFNRRSLSNDK